MGSGKALVVRYLGVGGPPVGVVRFVAEIYY